MRDATTSFRCLLLIGLAFSLGASCSQSTSAGDKSAVAIVNGDAITEDDLDIEGQLVRLEQQAYQQQASKTSFHVQWSQDDL